MRGVYDMLPVQDNMDVMFRLGVEEVIAPSLTYRMDIEREIISGYVDNVEALKQAIYKEINTEPGVYPIYRNYGVKKADLFGKPKSYAYMVLCSRIEEALIDDDRIEAVHSFFYHEDKSKRDELCMSFTVDSIFGEIEMSEVSVLGI